MAKNLRKDPETFLSQVEQYLTGKKGSVRKKLEKSIKK